MRAGAEADVMHRFWILERGILRELVVMSREACEAWSVWVTRALALRQAGRALGIQQGALLPNPATSGDLAVQVRIALIGESKKWHQTLDQVGMTARAVDGFVLEIVGERIYFEPQTEPLRTLFAETRALGLPPPDGYAVDVLLRMNSTSRADAPQRAAPDVNMQPTKAHDADVSAATARVLH